MAEQNNNRDEQDKGTERDKRQEEKILETGQLTLNQNSKQYRIHLLTIIGEIEGHECLSSNVKTTKYEHVLPQLAAIEDNQNIDGMLILINTVGGDIDAGLALAEMIASLSIPTVSLVLGGSHSIGVPLAVSADYSFIVESGAMLVHPVRMNGMIIGAPQTYEYFQRLQNRITGFIAAHSRVSQERVGEMMMETGELTKDLGTILIGKDAVKEGLIDAIGGIQDALSKLYDMISERHSEQAN